MAVFTIDVPPTNGSSLFKHMVINVTNLVLCNDYWGCILVLLVGTVDEAMVYSPLEF